jgi:hypothetical protein
MKRTYRIVDKNGTMIMEDEDKKIIQKVIESLKFYFGNTISFKLLAIGKSENQQ